MTEEREYLFGTDEAELRRLGLQHQLWAGVTAAAWERGGFGPGQRLLDVGCGPGHATFDLARLVGASGRVTGVDVSARFVAHVQSAAAARGEAHVSAEVQDVEALDLPEAHFDGAYARWVLCFVGRPGAVVEGVARALRPGGRFVIHDYSLYAALQLAPPSPVFDRVVAAVNASWRDGGGDPDVGAVLPSLLVDAGFEIEHLRPVSRIARPHTALWQWPRSFFDNYLPLLVRNGYLTADERAAFDALWEDRTRDPGAYFCTPPMVEIVAVRRGALSTSR